MQKFKRYLASTDFGVLLLIGGVIVQAFHSYYIFRELSNFDKTAMVISSLFYAIIFSCAILFYTMTNKRDVALRFQIFESFINLYYFFGKFAEMLKNDEMTLWQIIPNAIIIIGISIMLPYIIYMYAGSVSEDNDKQTNYSKESIRIDTKRNILKGINSMKDINKLKEKYLKEK